MNVTDVRRFEIWNFTRITHCERGTLHCTHTYLPAARDNNNTFVTAANSRCSIRFIAYTRRDVKTNTTNPRKIIYTCLCRYPYEYVNAILFEISQEKHPVYNCSSHGRFIDGLILATPCRSSRRVTWVHAEVGRVECTARGVTAGVII